MKLKRNPFLNETQVFLGGLRPYRPRFASGGWEFRPQIPACDTHTTLSKVQQLLQNFRMCCLPPSNFQYFCSCHGLFFLRSTERRQLKSKTFTSADHNNATHTNERQKRMILFIKVCLDRMQPFRMTLIFCTVFLATVSLIPKNAHLNS